MSLFCKHQVMAILCINDWAIKSVEFLESLNIKIKWASKIKRRMTMPDGKIAYAETKIDNSIIMLADEFEEMGRLNISLLFINFRCILRKY